MHVNWTHVTNRRSFHLMKLKLFLRITRDADVGRNAEKNSMRVVVAQESV